MAERAALAVWGRKPDPRTELERLAAEIEGIFLRMPVDHQKQVAGTIRAMLETAGGLRVLPDELAGALGRTLWRFFSELNMPFKRKVTPEMLLGQIARGAPVLLERLGTSEQRLLATVGE